MAVYESELVEIMLTFVVSEMKMCCAGNHQYCARFVTPGISSAIVYFALNHRQIVYVRREGTIRMQGCSAFMWVVDSWL